MRSTRAIICDDRFGRLRRTLLVPLSAEVSAGLTQALAIISEEKLTKRGSGHPARSAVDDDGDPQPHVDHDRLEGYFHSLNR
jgi:hypothetical protein